MESRYNRSKTCRMSLRSSISHDCLHGLPWACEGVVPVLLWYNNRLGKGSRKRRAVLYLRPISKRHIYVLAWMEIRLWCSKTSSLAHVADSTICLMFWADVPIFLCSSHIVWYDHLERLQDYNLGAYAQDATPSLTSRAREVSLGEECTGIRTIKEYHNYTKLFFDSQSLHPLTNHSQQRPEYVQ